MTEAEWLACTEPATMLEFLRGNASDRKLRLFAAACCRAIWRWISDEQVRRAVEIAERFADGRAKASELMTAHGAIRERLLVSNADTLIAVNWAAHPAVNALGASGWACNAEASRTRKAIKHFRRRHCKYIGDIFGNPFRPSPLLPAAVLAWNDGTVRRIAEGIYQEHELPAGTLNSARLAILADALIDAGSDDEQLIAHCRNDGPHVRGCWAIDLILGKS